MKTTALLIGAAALMLGACQPKGTGDATKCAESFADLKANFADPNATFRPAPFWVWNGTMTKEFIDQSMEDLKDHGFGGVFVHPRYGMTNEYLSDEWFDLFKYAVEKGKELGMDVWIYDENSYPSGFAGGHVPDKMPESYNQGNSLHEKALTQLKKEDLDKYIAIFEATGNGYNNITEKAADYVGKKGNFLAYEKITPQIGNAWNAGFCYVDLIKPGVTEFFLKTTIEDGYKPIVGNEFGKTIKGSFTDEPNIAPTGDGNFRWTPDLFDRFRERYGYNLEDNLPSIKNNVGDYQRVRHDYYQLLLQLFIDRWSKPSYDYYEANNLEFTGHYWEHGWPVPHHGGDNMAMYAWHQRPAIDLLFNQMDDPMPTQFGDVRNVKELSSVANQMGRCRTLSETYGGAGWDLTFDDMKRLGDWEYVLGVNTLNQHLHFQTLLGCRKHDYPQSFSYHAPYWDQYTALNDYFGRLSYALSAGEQVNDIVIFEPTTTAWIYYQAGGEGEKNEMLNNINVSFRELLNGLEVKQVEYDLASENIVKDHGKVDGKQFIIGDRAYKTVILPEYSETLDKASVDLLSQFLRNGGEVIVIGDKPSRIDGVTTTFGDEWNKAQVENNNISAIAKLQNEAIKFKNINPGDGRFYHMRRELKDGQILFFVNSSKNAKAGASLSMPGESVLLMNTMDGSITNYPHETKNGEVSFEFEIEPTGSILFFISDKKLNGYENTKQATACENIAPVGEMEITAEANVLALDYPTLVLDGKTYPDIHTSDATDNIFKARGFKDGDVWFSAMQYKKNIMDRDTFSNGTGFKVDYKFNVNGKFDYSGIKAVLEQQYPATITINGNEITPIQGEYYLDRDFKVFAIGKYIKEGENTLTVNAPKMSVFAEIEPAYIVGDFNVQPAKKGFVLNAPVALGMGSWKQQGYPFYWNSVSYINTYNVTDPKAGYAVKLDNWKGTVAEVIVNGTPAGIIGWKPYTLDVTNLVKEGDNTIEVKIKGSLRNVLGPFNKAPNGIVTPWSWRFQPPVGPGSDYMQLDYGLLTPFSFCKQ